MSPSGTPQPLARSLWAGAGILAVALASGACRRAATGDPAPAASGSAVPTGLSPESAAQTVAKVGERTITLGDYAAVLERMDRFERLRYQAPERRRELLEEIIRVELLAEEARRRGLDRKPETQERIRQVLRDEVLHRLRESLPAPEEIPAGEVRAYYDAHQSEFRDPERRRVARIMVAERTAAERVLDEAVKASPAQWGELVQKHSLDQKAGGASAAAPELAGDVGIVSRPTEGEEPQDVPAEIRQAVFEIDKLGGVLPRVVAAGGRYHILRLTGKTAARTRSFADAERAIRVTLVQERIREAEQDLERKLRQRFEVKVDEAALAQVKIPPAEKAARGRDGDGSAPR